MTQDGLTSLWDALTRFNGDSSFLSDAETRLTRADLVEGSVLCGRADELRGRSVAIVTKDQLATALVLFELDGIARRIVIYPNEPTLEYLPLVVDVAKVDAIVSDRTSVVPAFPHVRHYAPCTRAITHRSYDRSSKYQTEWITFTSGTMGPPKLVVHTLSSLMGAIRTGNQAASKTVWSTHYDIRRFGGLQVFLRAALSGASLALSSPTESVGVFLARLGTLGITHISGTPSQWRRALMSGSAHCIAPEYIRLSGEIADQALLNRLCEVYPQSRIVHAFGSSEAGTVFEVHDGMAGFPAELIGHASNVEMQIKNQTLWVRSSRAAIRYLGDSAPALKDADGFVDTGDLLELHNGRYYFIGRRDGRINVGGLKVHPEEVEAVINRHPHVHLSRVRAKRNPVTGAIVVADVVLNEQPASDNGDQNAIQDDIVQFCRESLPSYKVPAAIRIVPALAVAASGKMIRNAQ